MSEHLQKTMVSMSAAQGRAVEQIAEHVSLDEVPDMPLEDSEAYEKEELIDNVRLIAKAFDPSGTGRILMGIHEVLTDEDKMAVRAMAVPLEVNKGTV
jgi:hypothetical protein